MLKPTVDPPSRVPAVNSKGASKSLRPGNGLAPMRFNSEMMNWRASVSPSVPVMRPPKRSEASVCTYVRSRDASADGWVAAAAASANASRKGRCLMAWSGIA